MIKRLNRIEGQIRGLSGMIENDRDCIEVLRQVVFRFGSNPRGLDADSRRSLCGCIYNATIHDGNKDHLIDELIDHLGKIR